MATAAGVSAQTVSRVVRDPASVGEATRARVESAIAATGYVPNLAASNLASNRSRTVAALVPQINASVFADTVHAFSTALAAHGYQIFVGTTDYRPEHEEEVLRSFLGRRPDGLLMVGTSHTPGTLALLTAAGVPVVETWGWSADPVDVLVGFSNAAAASAMVTHLVERGRRRITFAGRHTAGDSRAGERLDGYVSAVRDLLGSEPRTVDAGPEPVTMDTGVALLDQVLQRYPDSDAVLFSSDVFAAGALQACVRRGIDVPGTLALAGFGDFELARHLVPALTTVAVPSVHIGELAADLLLARMRGGRVERPHRDVGYRVVVREST
ncbi:LacI family DNA-binding transcriptional regulator [Prauserella cavernicola]|uniref:LacI family DNA-binding transcriptional regulator n=1 Tax=Prauserella cavernicola TaxID=2800127 RepID=A0A934QQY7_9PSEU|nr:LacI family DNA-binding transcriptional regulator [Prauserella cavernicola]MBK1783848.1 LacI family DNA-binding transcriptional regulator [Prauserella cavernicola]